MANSKLTSKFQATIPKEIRATLGLKKGDHIIFEITRDNHVEIRKATATDVMYLKSVESTLNEWDSKNDTQDFRDL